MKAPRTRVGISRGIGMMGVTVLSELKAWSEGEGVAREKSGEEFEVGGDHVMEKCLVLEGLMRMLRRGSAVWRRLMAFCAPSEEREKT